MLGISVMFLGLMVSGPVHAQPIKRARACLQARVEAAGGQILFWNGVRVMGVLAVSRAIGDHCLRPFVIAQPEVRTLHTHSMQCSPSSMPEVPHPHHVPFFLRGLLSAMSHD